MDAVQLKKLQVEVCETTKELDAKHFVKRESRGLNDQVYVFGN